MSHKATRETWKAVTIGTPKCGTGAVSDILAMPPGEDARMAVPGWMPVNCASASAKPAASSMSRVQAATLAR
jgi:hypothetical protein